MNECKNDGQPSMRIKIAGRTEQMCLDTGSGYACTRPEGHDGDHAAHGGDGEICAVWPVALPPELDALLVKAQDLAEEMRKHNLTHLGQLQLR